MLPVLSDISFSGVLRQCSNEIWVSGATTDSQQGKGRFSHVADVAFDNTLLVVGGYRGNVLGDVIAYTVPKAVSKNWVNILLKIIQRVVLSVSCLPPTTK